MANKTAPPAPQGGLKRSNDSASSDALKKQKTQLIKKPATHSASKPKDDKKAQLMKALNRSKEISSSNPTKKPKQPTAAVDAADAPKKLPSTLSKLPPQAKSIAKPAAQHKLTDLQEKMKKTLSGGRFRMINEQLYTTTSDVAVDLFKEAPETFDIYHEGFRAQVETWPSNPVDYFISTLYKQGAKPSTTTPLIIADMGCGEAALAKSLMSHNTSTSHKFLVHSFDLASPNPYVVACDIRSVPLEDESVDVVVFSLSLMGTNFEEFLQEAWRILKQKGQLRIAEVVSRFPDVSKFVEALTRIGFKLTKKDASNKMFILLDFLKGEKPGRDGAAGGKKKNKAKSAAEEEDAEPLLTPCLYRKR
ncbi:25S rRNA (adenine645-N1)-methyltransferase [Podochytrium sp. JEL0797]|nr:25S rRNA (adenine645-N1)-methyltransferase [Podochytrium sp. JEL0797]